VIFTDSPAPPPSPDFYRSELLDSLDVANGVGAKLLASPSLATALHSLGEPAVAAMANLARFLRPDFDRVATLATTIWAAERSFIALTEEQYDVLDHVASNECALVTGGAGTGKTVLAVELTRRLAADGRSVLLSCFNRELGLWLERRCHGFGPGRVVAGHMHLILRPRLEAAGLLADAQATENPAGWYDLGALAVGAETERFDTIVVDEAQDFAANALIDLVEAWRRDNGGTPGVCLFADFSRQALYGDAAGAREVIRRRLHSATFVLRRNCRNTRKIAAETAALTGEYDVRVSDVQPQGPAVERIYFATPDRQRKTLDRALQTLRAEGFNAADIVVLGPRRLDNSVLAGATACGGYRIASLADRQSNAGVVYSTIQAFKGLESPAVVLVDLELRGGHDTDAMLYVGMTRARTRLVMLLPEKARAEVGRRERENLIALLS
jgi:hypothetical protein